MTPQNCNKCHLVDDMMQHIYLYRCCFSACFPKFSQIEKRGSHPRLKFCPNSNFCAIQPFLKRRIWQCSTFLLLDIYIYYDKLNWMSGNKSDKLSLKVKRFIKREAAVKRPQDGRQNKCCEILEIVKRNNLKNLKNRQTFENGVFFWKHLGKNIENLVTFSQSGKM